MKRAGAAPEPEERFLHRVLGERFVAEHAVGEPVGGAADPVVELGERRLVRPGDERDERFVGEVGEVAAAAHRLGRRAYREHGWDAGQHDPHSSETADRFGSIPTNRSIEPVPGRAPNKRP